MNDNLNQFQFYHHQPGQGGKMHQITAYNNHDETVGWLSWAAKKMPGAKPGEIQSLRVRPDVRRQGLATAMFHQAQGLDPPAEHSSKRSPEGSAFAKSTGTKVPKLSKPIPSEDSIGLSHEGLMQMEQFGKQGRKL